jgi:cytochrome c553
MLLTVIVLLLSAATAGNAAEPSATAEQLRFFESAVRPLLVEHCLKCHGPEKQWANLRVDSRAALLQGGDSGPAIVPGKPDESRLLRAVQQVDESLKMPPEGEKLTARQIADLARWIAWGAPFPPSEAPRARDRNPAHWSFQPPVKGAIPAVRQADWPANPVDQFILAKLESAGLSPAPRADRRTLIRRVTFDLWGLPPTPEEVAEFLDDSRPEAYERLIDRLLASPAYGERWGRHWLDVARYADSNGLDENVAHGNAWRYRDYVVASWNADKPYDRFVREQLAGDLLPWVDDSQRRELLIATGFLAIGPKVLAEVDEAKMEMDIVDEQIDTVGRALLGLTLGCARCHDHKFDPIDMTDYYGLAGIFKSTRTMEHFKKVARWYENVLPSPETTALQTAHAAQLALKQQEIRALVAHADAQLSASSPPESNAPEDRERRYPAETQAALKKLRQELAHLEKNPPDLPSAMGVTEGRPADVAIHLRGNPLKLGAVVPRRTPAALRGPEPPAFSADQSGRRELADWLTDPQHPLTSRVLVNRIWRWHFGRGLVPSVDNFGLLGEAPTHPELLDWLASEFVADGWSIKALHRLLLTSATYQQSSQHASADEQALRVDPENRWFGRAPVRRLEAEQFRDALLAVSGQLDDSLGGSLLTVKNRAYFFDHTSKDLTDYSSRRRSLYLPVVRNNVYDLFQLLDFPDPAIPNGDRATTTVAPQALLLLNSEFVLQCAERLAQRVLREAVDDACRVDRLYHVAYSRAATPAEVHAAATFLRRFEESWPAVDRSQAWTALCQVILAANEFLYVN